MDHRAFLERWFSELWGKRDARLIDECMSETCAIAGLPGTAGRAQFRAFYEAFGAAFPEVHLTVDECLSDGDRFAVRCSGHVVDRAGRTHRLTGGSMGRTRDGQLVETWNQWDFLGLLESMEAVPRGVLAAVIQSQIRR